MQQLPTPTSSESSQPTPPPPSTSSTLESFCWQFLDCVNTRDFTCPHLLPHISSNFTATAPGQVPCNSITELLQNRRNLVSKFPDLKLHFIAANTEVREETDWAECHMFTEIRGMPVGVRRQVLNVFRWRRVKESGKWMCVEFTFLARQPVEEDG